MLVDAVGTTGISETDTGGEFPRWIQRAAHRADGTNPAAECATASETAGAPGGGVKRTRFRSGGADVVRGPNGRFSALC